jgi:hypothetical protein
MAKSLVTIATTLLFSKRGKHLQCQVTVVTSKLIIEMIIILYCLFVCSAAVEYFLTADSLFTS